MAYCACLFRWNVRPAACFVVCSEKNKENKLITMANADEKQRLKKIFLKTWQS
jgi:hypothetical protein